MRGRPFIYLFEGRLFSFLNIIKLDVIMRTFVKFYPLCVHNFILSEAMARTSLRLGSSLQLSIKNLVILCKLTTWTNVFFSWTAKWILLKNERSTNREKYIRDTWPTKLQWQTPKTKDNLEGLKTTHKTDKDPLSS